MSVSQGDRPPRRAPSADDLADEILVGPDAASGRAALGRAITLVESRRADHRRQARALLRRLLPHTGGAVRVGITGVPGVGKSTFIEALGSRLTARGHRVAVLAVDPSSSISRGSILGDKTRMTSLAADPRAFVRPSPSGGSLGGVATRTREAMLVCEAAGYDVVLVETVGVGQSEIAVAGMVDFLLLLVLAGAGDDLQGIKRGILELVDLVAIHKADGDNVLPAQRARAQLEAALRFVRPPSPPWRPPVRTASSLEGTGLDEIWDDVCRHRTVTEEAGLFESRRREQRVEWLWTTLEDGLLAAFRDHAGVADLLADTEARVAAGALTIGEATDILLERFLGTDRLAEGGGALS